MTVIATSSSDYLSRERQEVSPIGSGKQEERDQKSPGGLSHSRGKRTDNLELSVKARDLLKSVTEQVHQLLSENQEYEHFFISSKGMESSHPVSQGIMFLNRSKTFLSDPHIQNIAQNDGNFAAFYDEISSIGVNNSEALKLLQDEMKSAPAPTYHSMFR
jgi:hypothetical protein